MIKLMHGADLHLDSPFAGLPADQAAARRAEQRSLLERLSQTCREQGCRLLLLAGDLFDARQVYRDTVDALRDALDACGAQVFIAPGNHDCLCPGSPYLTEAWPDNVHIFKTAAVSSVACEPLGCRVYGAAFLQPHCESLLEGFRAQDDGLVNLMVLHGDATQEGSDYNPVSRQQIAQSGLQYLALGHIHKRALSKAGSTCYGWPGCTMGRGFDETGAKGVYVGTVDARTCEMEFLPMGARRYEILQVAATDDPLAAVEAAIPPDAGEDIYRILLTGECERVDLPALYAALEPRFYALSLRDKTVPPVDLWAQADANTLKGGFLRTLKAHYDAASPEQRPVIARAARLGLDLMEGREVSLP